MGEDQIRTELAETRALVRESHTDMVNEVKESNKETRDFIKWVVGVCAVFMVGLCIDHVAMRNRVSELSNDFGTALFICPPDHSEVIQFDMLKNKYNPYRGLHTEGVTPELNQQNRRIK